jgi:hypothetical protein
MYNACIMPFDTLAAATCGRKAAAVAPAVLRLPVPAGPQHIDCQVAAVWEGVPPANIAERGILLPRLGMATAPQLLDNAAAGRWPLRRSW